MKNKRNFWEKIFKHPSFNKRFFVFVTIATIAIALAFLFLVFTDNIVSTAEEKIAMGNLIIQFATLIMGIFAAYYALRQLVETRFTALDQSASNEVEKRHYSRAYSNWKDAFYIKRDPYIFLNMIESLLLIKDYQSFDRYVNYIENTNNILNERSDQLIFLFLKATRHFLVENLGEGKSILSDLIELNKHKKITNTGWEFNTLLASNVYRELEENSEAQIIINKLSQYIDGKLTEKEQVTFESGQYFKKQVDNSTQLTAQRHQ